MYMTCEVTVYCDTLLYIIALVITEVAAICQKDINFSESVTSEQC